MLKKLLCLLLAGLMLASTVACGTPEPDAGEVGSQTVAAVTEGEGTEELKPDLPKMDYKGDAFTILAKKDSFPYLLASKTNGEVVNDAVAEANLSVSQQFNIKFDTITIDSDMDSGIIQAYIMAGDDEYDVAYLHDCTTATMTLNGWFLNANDLPYLDSSAPWWPRFIVESLTLNGKMYHFANYSSYQSMSATQACFFNQKILTEYQSEDPYELVRAGDWTLDKLMALSTAIYSDVNGDGQQNTEDLFGFAYTHYPYGWLESFGIELYHKEGPDSSVLTLETGDERCYELIETLHTWFYSGYDGVWVNFGGDAAESRGIFSVDRAAFTFASVGLLAPQAVEADIDYGIVPMPKLNKNQKDYYASANSSLMTIPTTVRDTERVGIILEAMAYAGYKHILPAYCEKTLKTRFATDPDCAEMLNLILESQVISFAYLFANAVPQGMQYRFIADTVERNKVSSFFKSKQRKEQKMLDTIMAFYED